MAANKLVITLLVVSLVVAQAARPLQGAEVHANPSLTAPAFSDVFTTAVRTLMQKAQPTRPTRPKTAKSGDSASAAFKRVPSGSTRSAGH